MSAPDLNKMMPGDEVLVRLTVNRVAANDYRGLAYVVCEPAYNDEKIIVLLGHVASHTPKALAVGDRVKAAEHVNTWKDKLHSGVIRAIDGEQAWLRWDHLDREPYSTDNIWPLADLERAQ